MSKYHMLVDLLDQIKEEAPPEFKKYHNLKSEEEKNNINSLVYIHLLNWQHFSVQNL